MEETISKSATVRIDDVARRAEVSVATVSRVMNGNTRVSEDLAARVHSAAADLGYRPNAVARSLRKRGAQAWQLVLSDISNPFYMEVAKGVEDVAAANGYSVLLGNSGEDLRRERRYLEVALEEQVAGVIIAPQRRTAEVDGLLAQGIPVVAVNQPVDASVDCVRADSQGGALAATRRLFACGWRRIVCITGPEAAETAWSRAAGYREACLEAGAEPTILHVTYDIAGGRQAAEDALKADPRPDAFFTANAMLGLGALEAIRARGLRLGDDVGFLTFDDAPWSLVTDPPVSVVAQHPYQIGSQAARMLLARIAGEGPSVPVTQTLETTLVTRGSCGSTDVGKRAG